MDDKSTDDESSCAAQRAGTAAAGRRQDAVFTLNRLCVFAALRSNNLRLSAESADAFLPDRVQGRQDACGT